MVNGLMSDGNENGLILMVMPLKSTHFFEFYTLN